MMESYKYKATELIAESFEEHGVFFDVRQKGDGEIVSASFPIDCGPEVTVMFISQDNDNDVAIRIHGLIFKTPEDRRCRIVETCNYLNHKIRYTKFCVDNEGNINVEYDLPVHSPDEGLGEMAFEIFIRMMQILDSEYNIFMQALYSEEEIDFHKTNSRNELRRKLMELQQKVDSRITSYEDIEDTECDPCDLESAIDIEDYYGEPTS